jgi:hypothetical protein
MNQTSASPGAAQGDEDGVIFTEEEVLHGFRSGFYTSKGFLYTVLQLVKPDGTPYIQPSELKDYCLKHGMGRGAYYKAARQLQSEEGIRLLGEVLSVEKQIRDRLQQQLGGLVEVATPVGRIDLLTNTEIIEVKHVSDWKSALGQILAYGAYYPEHQKRIHLFGETHSLRTVAVQSTCSDLDVTTTFEQTGEV